MYYSEKENAFLLLSACLFELAQSRCESMATARTEGSHYADRDPLSSSTFYRHVVYSMSAGHRVLCGCWQRYLIKISREGKKEKSFVFPVNDQFKRMTGRTWFQICKSLIVFCTVGMPSEHTQLLSKNTLQCWLKAAAAFSGHHAAKGQRGAHCSHHYWIGATHPLQWTLRKGSKTEVHKPVWSMLWFVKSHTHKW